MVRLKLKASALRAHAFYSPPCSGPGEQSMGGGAGTTLRRRLIVNERDASKVSHTHTHTHTHTLSAQHPFSLMQDMLPKSPGSNFASREAIGKHFVPVR